MSDSNHVVLTGKKGGLAVGDQWTVSLVYSDQEYVIDIISGKDTYFLVYNPKRSNREDFATGGQGGRYGAIRLTFDWDFPKDGEPNTCTISVIVLEEWEDEEDEEEE